MCLNTFEGMKQLQTHLRLCCKGTVVVGIPLKYHVDKHTTVGKNNNKKFMNGIKLEVIRK